MLTTGLDRRIKEDTRGAEAAMLTTGLDRRNSESTIGADPAKLTTGLDRRNIEGHHRRGSSHVNRGTGQTDHWKGIIKK